MSRVLELIDGDVGRPISAFQVKIPNLDIAAISNKVLETLIPSETEFAMEHGEVVIVKAQPYRTSTNVIKGVVLSFLDVSEIRHIKQELKDVMLHQYSLDYMIEITDEQGKIVYVNDAFSKKSGYEPKELIGQFSSILKSGKTSIATYKELKTALDKGQSWSGQFVNKTKSGELYTESVKIFSLHQKQANAKLFVKISQELN